MVVVEVLDVEGFFGSRFGHKVSEWSGWVTSF